MPTPSGMLKAGDVIQDSAGNQCRVIRREGNDQLYSVILERVDGKLGPHNQRSWRMTEAAYWLTQGWRVVDPSRAKILDALCAANPDFTRPRLEKIMQLTLQMAGKK